MIRKQVTGIAAGKEIALLVVRDGRHPWAIALLLGCIISGILGLVVGPNPRAPVDQYMPPTLRAIYYIVLAVSGLITLIGVWLPDLRDRLMVEQIGLWFLCMPLMIYPIAVVTVYSGPLGLGGVISCLIGFGGLIRIIEIMREIRRWHHGVRQ